jgi:hypothetical protein
MESRILRKNKGRRELQLDTPSQYVWFSTNNIKKEEG